MGGSGSGGANKAHRTVEDYRRLDSFELRRFMDDCEEPHEIYGPLHYNGGDILLDTSTAIRWGDDYRPLKLYWVEGIDGDRSRLFFCCPHCKRRVRYLYNFEDFYICRHCLDANYTSQQATKKSLQNIRRKMRLVVENDLEYTWWQVDHPGRAVTDLALIPKPRYMRWRKYEQLVRQYRGLQEEYLSSFAKLWAHC